MTFTDAQRNRAYGMFADGKTSQQVASRLRTTVGSIAALRANWTRQGSPNPTASTSSRRSTSGSHSSTVVTTIPLSRAQARRVAQAYENGQQVSLNISS